MGMVTKAFNVAMTRARYLLIVVGNAKTLLWMNRYIFRDSTLCVWTLCIVFILQFVYTKLAMALWYTLAAMDNLKILTLFETQLEKNSFLKLPFVLNGEKLISLWKLFLGTFLEDSWHYFYAFDYYSIWEGSIWEYLSTSTHINYFKLYNTTWVGI